VDQETYLTGLRNRLLADGCETADAEIGQYQALVGYRSDRLPQMLFSKIHLTTVAVPIGTAGPREVEQVVRQVGAYAKARSGRRRGAHSGVAAFAVLIADEVLPEGAEATTRPAKVEFAMRIRPAIVNLSNGSVHTFQGRQLWGFAMNGYLQRKFALYFPAERLERT